MKLRTVVILAAFSCCAAEPGGAPISEEIRVERYLAVPMRDGVKLYTVIVVPRGATNAPIIMTRTPYNAAGRTTRGFRGVSTVCERRSAVVGFSTASAT